MLNQMKLKTVTQVKLLIGLIGVQMYKASMNRKCCSSYKIIFMDLNMPVMDGIRAAEKILSIKTLTSKPKIIAVTAFASDEEQGKSII